MEKKSRIERSSVMAYVLVSALFVLFFVYAGVFEKNSVYEARDSRAFTPVTDYSVKELPDPQAPAGIRREYSWALGDVGTGEDCLGFYLVHNYAQVYFDEELLYRLLPGRENLLCRGVSSNWVMVPVYPQDSGKQVRVVVTPVYESAVGFEVEFFIGSHLAIYLNQLKKDLPQIILSALSILMGLLIMAVQVFLTVKKKNESWAIFYLGNFSMLLGVWKITDTRFSPLMFSGNPLILGYIAIGLLFLSTIPVLFSVREHFAGYPNTPISVVSLICCAAALGALLCQILGIAELKQLLTLSHILIVLTALTLAATVAVRGKQKAGRNIRWYWNPVWILIPGIVSDLIRYYWSRSSSGLMYTMAAFLIYTAGLFTANFLEINRMAKTDALTGLFNKSHWDQVMREGFPATEPIGLMMFDLNGLKQINDTMGHEAGDRVLTSFSNILRNSIPKSETICRWGGDEFTVMVTDASREKMEAYLSEIGKAVSAYNASWENLEIHYAAGYVLSSEFPGYTRKRLLQMADERMYQDKQAWYRENEKAPH